jgi:hypothetical protein
MFLNGLKRSCEAFGIDNNVKYSVEIINENVWFP